MREKNTPVAQYRRDAITRFTSMAVGETVKMPLPVAQPARRDCYRTTGAAAHSLWGAGSYSIRQRGDDVEVTRHDGPSERSVHRSIRDRPLFSPREFDINAAYQAWLGE